MEKSRKQRNTIEPYDKDVHVRVRKEYLEKLKEQANKKGFTYSRMVRYILEEYLDRES